MQIENLVNLCYSDRISEVIKDYRQFNTNFKSKKDEVSSNNAEPIPWWSSEASKEGAQKDYLCADVLTSIAVLNGPSVLDDTASAYKQIKSRFKDNFQDGYDYRKAQHPFSFFRGTALNDYLNPNSEKCIDKNLAKKVIKYDKSLVDSKLGDWIMKKLKVDEVKIEYSKIKSILHTPETPNYVKVKTYKSPTKFGDITARALTRTPVLGLATLGGTKLIHTGHQIADGEDPIEELKKATLDFGITATAVGYLGAIGAKKLGVFGSLVGTALGSAVSDYAMESLSSGDKKPLT